MCVYIHVLIVWHDNIVDYNIMYIRTSTATQKTSITCFSSIVIEYVDNGLCIRTIIIYICRSVSYSESFKNVTY